MTKSISTYLNGSVIRMRNRRISFEVKNGDIGITFENVDGHANEKACSHKCIRGKIRQTRIKMSLDAMEALCGAYIEYKKYIIKNETSRKNISR